MNNPFKIPFSAWQPIQIIALLFFCLLAILIILTTINLTNLEQNKQLFLEQSQAKLDQDLRLHAQHMREQIINVQQWLTDFSVTRGQDGLDQGFEQAERSATLFRNGLTTLQTILNKRTLQQDRTQQGDQLSREFDLYLRTGTEMAQAYIQSGTMAGNLLMLRFDAQAATLGKAFEDLLRAQHIPTVITPPPAFLETSEWFHLTRIWQLMMGREHYATYVDVQQQYAQLLTSQQDGLSQLAPAAQALREDILQTQQWLTDISVTRGQDGMDDGFRLAQERIDHFLSHIEPFRVLVRLTGKPEWLAMVEPMENNFRAYYETGFKMAAAYIQEGTSQGNALMKIFDQQAEQLVEALRPFLGKTLERAGLQEFQVELTRQALENTRLLLWGLLALLILLMVGTTGWFLRSFQAP